MPTTINFASLFIYFLFGKLFISIKWLLEFSKFNLYQYLTVQQIKHISEHQWWCKFKNVLQIYRNN